MEELNGAFGDEDKVEADAVAVKFDAVEDGTVGAVDAAEFADEAVEADTVVVDTVVADAAEVKADAADADASEAEAVAVKDGHVDVIKRPVTFGPGPKQTSEHQLFKRATLASDT